jgi:hypothetical protein
MPTLPSAQPRQASFDRAVRIVSMTIALRTSAGRHHLRGNDERFTLRRAATRWIARRPRSSTN